MAKENKARFVILGLLAHEPMSGYDIKKRIEYSISNFYDISYGQIYPELARMEVANLLTEPSDGTYYFDSKNSSLIEFNKVLNNINDIGSKPVIEYTQAKTDSKSLLNVVSNSKSIIATVLLTMLLVLLNVFSSTYNWINGRRKEISIRKMVGATDREISRYIIKGYLLLVTISFIIGFIGSVIFIKVYHPPLTGETVSPWVIVFNYIFVNVIGLMIITASLNSYYRKQIIQVLR
jgi:ABC-type antimicrobial peptide transport system permease subunit